MLSILAEACTPSAVIDVLSSDSSLQESIESCEMIFGEVELGEDESLSLLSKSFPPVTGFVGQMILSWICIA